MVVDDEPALQSLVFDTLGDDYRLFHAHNGRAALERVSNFRPDLILMDVMMPDIGGYEAVRLLQENEASREIPVIMISAMDFDPSTVQMLRSEPNVKGFLMKPFRPRQLREIVKSTIESRNR